MSPNGPLSFFLIFCNKLKFQKDQKVPPFTLFDIVIFFGMIIFCQKISFFQFLKTLRFLSLRYSADFRRSRLVLQTTILTLIGPLFRNNPERRQVRPRAKGQGKLSAKGPLFRFSLLLGNLRNGTGLKSPPFRFFFDTVRLFFEIFLSPKGPSFRFLLFQRNLQNRPRLNGFFF